jgi:hypothetical protein
MLKLKAPLVFALSCLLVGSSMIAMSIAAERRQASQRHQEHKGATDEDLPMVKGQPVSEQAMQSLLSPADAGYVPDVSTSAVLRVGDYAYENTAKVISAPASGPTKSIQSILGSRPASPLAVISTGESVREFRTIALRAGAEPVATEIPIDKPVATGGRPGPTEIALCTDNQIVKLSDGSLLAVRNSITWEANGPKPWWWEKATIQGKPMGSRVATVVWWSKDGTHWQRRSVVDPLDFEGGRYAVPRLPGSEVNCDQGCFGGWDRVEVYSDPFSNDVYMTILAAGGALSFFNPGQRPDFPVATNLVFKSMDAGKTWHQILNFGAWTPIVMTTTQDGRLFLYSCFGEQPMLWYTTVNSGTDVQFSEAYPVNLTANGSPVKAGSGGVYAEVVYKATNSISRISGDGETSKVRLTYPVVDAAGNTALAVMIATVKPVNKKPFVKSLGILQAKSGSIFASQFIDPDAEGASKLKSSSAALYWIEGSKQTGRVRCLVCNGETMSPAADVCAAFSPTGSTGHYLSGGSYVENGQVKFLAQWAQPAGIFVNSIGVRLLGAK